MLRALLLFLLPLQALAWGPRGHAVVARLAQERLTPATLRAIQALRGGPLDKKSLRTRDTGKPYRFIDRDLGRFLDPRKPLDLALVSSWADGWRTHHPETGAWHYVELEAKGGAVASDIAKACPGGGCVTAQIRAQEARLADGALGADERLKALFWLVHLVADVHQPLHCAGIGDRGGNATRVRFFGKPMSLHEVWDEGLLSRDRQRSARLAWALGHSISREEEWAWGHGSPEEWALESRVLARDTAYAALPLGSEPYLGKDYQDRARPVALSQLKKAGVRLAWILNDTLK